MSTVAVDFDGTIHPYTKGWIGSTPEDEPPIDGAIEFLAQLRSDGYRVVIFSTRCDNPEGLKATVRWLDKWSIPYDAVTCQKIPAVAYVDDRAVPYLGNWEDARAGVDRLAGGRSHGAKK